jgi:hypothetical protein
MDVNLEDDMKKDAIVIAFLKDKEIATDFYRALCNMRWRFTGFSTPEEHTIARLKNEYAWSCSWRYSGGVIADIRNQHYNTKEDYIDYYCSGQEGMVTDLVKECFKRIGWEPYPWEDDE